MSFQYVGNVDPSRQRMIPDESDSQYILNWVAKGGNQIDKNKIDISKNKIGFYFDDENYSISIKDSQYILNFRQGTDLNDTSLVKKFNNKNYIIREYEYPDFSDSLALVTYEQITIGASNEKIIKNDLFIKYLNYKEHFSKNLLVNNISYLNFNGGMYLRANNVEDNSKNIYIYEVENINNKKVLSLFFHFHNKNVNPEYTHFAFTNIKITISNEIIKNFNEISYNSLYLFPPMKKDFDLSNEKILSDLESYSFFGINKNRPITNNVNYKTEYNNLFNQPIEIPNWGLQSVDISENKNSGKLSTLNKINTTTKNLLNCQYNNFPNFKYTIKRFILSSFDMYDLCYNDIHILNSQISYNENAWFLTGQPINKTQGHFVGQFSFKEGTHGEMIYETYTHINDSDIYNQVSNKYTIYFDISNGYLQFPEKYPDNLKIKDRDIGLGSWSGYDKYGPHQENVDKNATVARIAAEIFKEKKLQFVYYKDSSNNYHYAYWDNFKVDISNTDISFSDSSNIAIIQSESDNTGKAFKMKLVKQIRNRLISNPPDLSGTIYINIPTENDFSEWYIYIANKNELNSKSSTSYYKESYCNTIINPLFLIKSPNIWATENLILNKNTNYRSKLKKLWPTFPIVESITIPSGTQIELNTFFQKSNIRKIFFLGDIPDFRSLDFSGCHYLTVIYYLNGKNGWRVGHIPKNSSTYNNPLKIEVKPIPYNSNVIQDIQYSDEYNYAYYTGV